MKFFRCTVRPTSFGIKESEHRDSGGSVDCDFPIGAVIGSVFILAGCVMIMIVLFIFRHTGKLNDEHAERLRRDVSRT